jgi:hypothetical protein
MNLATADKIAKAVLYEGYMLYPYRPSSVKNQQRWNFGVLCPRSYSEAQNGSDAWSMQTDCLVECGSLTGIEVRVRFLHLVARSVGELAVPMSEVQPGEVPEFRLVDKLAMNGRVYQPWQEAVEREVGLPVYNVGELIGKPILHDFNFLAAKKFEYLRDEREQMAGIIVREGTMISGAIEVVAQAVEDAVFRVTVLICNTTPYDAPANATRDRALLSSTVSTHTILGVKDGKFVSLLAPPERLSDAAANCKNVGTWPVLVGEEGQYDTVLSSPIILYDYPQIAPESAGDLFDGTEIDEILSLRILTLTDDEKREMSESDERARQMLERTESMPPEQFMKLHGALRGLRPIDAGLDTNGEERR